MPAEKKPTYLRLSDDLKQKVGQLAKERDCQIADVIADLVDRGLRYDDQVRQKDELGRRVQTLRMDLQREQGGRVLAERQLAAAQQAMRHLQWFVSVPIATCKGCGATVTVEHVAAKHCPNPNPTPQCLQAAFNLLPQYSGSNAVLELIGGVAALVGGAVIVGAIGEAIGGGSDDRSGRATARSRRRSSTFG